MQWGVVAFIDVMGFKGMWQRGHGAPDVLDALTRTRDRASELAKRQNAEGGGDLWHHTEIEVRTFSDTVVVLSPMPAHTDYRPTADDEKAFHDAVRRYMLLRFVVLLMSKVVTEAAADEPPLLYRGSIAAGDFQANSFAFLGPAIDEAGKFFEAAEGAFVFLAPSAADVFRARPGLLGRALFEYFVNYSIPLKRDASLKTMALNPLMFLDPDKRADHSLRILAYFGAEAADKQLEAKRHNTREFLEFVGKHWLMN